MKGVEFEPLKVGFSQAQIRLLKMLSRVNQYLRYDL